MSGVRQHYLPQFLLKGFNSKIKGKEFYTWVFSNKGPPFETNTRKIGIEKEFYDSRSTLSLDDNITEIESKSASYLHDLRKIKNDERLDASKGPEIINHIFVRVKNIRSAIINVLDFLFGILIENLSSSETFQHFVLELVKKRPELVLNGIKKKYGNITKYQKRYILNKLVPKLVKENRDVFLNSFSQFLMQLRENIPKIITEAHLKALSKNIIPLKRISVIRQFKWKLLVREQGSFILGDVGPIARISKSNSYCSLLIGAQEFDLVLLPISNSHLIVGSEHNYNEEINIDFVNNSTSLCSIEYFVSSLNTDREKKYLRHLGRRSMILQESVLRKMTREFLSIS